MKFNRDNVGRFSNFKLKVKTFFKKVMFWSFVAGLVYGAFQIGANFYGQTVYAEKEVQVEVPTKAAVMDRIAQCESSNSQKKNGQVILNPNKNGTVDIGVFQINVKTWGKKAGEMGYDLAVEKDNRAFAQYLYENYGTEPWSSSKPCWNK